MGNKTLTYGNVDMLVLKLLENQDMYGYQIIEQLEKQSQNVFSLSAGSLYPLLHNLEVKDYVDTYEGDNNSKTPGKKRNNIRWKRARKIATQDLEQHIQDQFDAYVNQGMDSDPALEEAIKSMGDPQKIGKELDCAYRPKINILLIELTTAFLVLGVIIHYLLEGTLSKNNFIAIGIGCFAAVALYFFDYTFLLRHPLAIYTVHLFFSACLFAFEARNGINHYDNRDNLFDFSCCISSRTRYCY